MSFCQLLINIKKKELLSHWRSSTRCLLHFYRKHLPECNVVVGLYHISVLAYEKINCLLIKVLRVRRISWLTKAFVPVIMQIEPLAVDRAADFPRVSPLISGNLLAFLMKRHIKLLNVYLSANINKLCVLMCLPNSRQRAPGALVCLFFFFIILYRIEYGSKGFHSLWMCPFTRNLVRKSDIGFPSNGKFFFSVCTKII